MGDLWYLHREAILRIAGVCLLAGAAAIVVVGSETPRVTRVTDELPFVLALRVVAPVILVTAVAFLIRRWVWFDEDNPPWHLTPETTAIAGVLAVALTLALGSAGGTGRRGDARQRPTAVPTLSAVPAAGSLVRSKSATVEGRDFTASYPRGWTQRVSQPVPDMNRYALSSGGAVVDDAGIAPGEAALSVYVFPVSSIRAAGDSDPYDLTDPYDVAVAAVRTPRDATDLESVSGATAAELDGAAGVRFAVEYTYLAARNVQTDLVVRRGAMVFMVELNSPPAPALARTSAGALDQLLSSWRWTTPEAEMGPSGKASDRPRSQALLSQAALATSVSEQAVRVRASLSALTSGGSAVMLAGVVDPARDRMKSRMTMQRHTVSLRQVGEDVWAHGSGESEWVAGKAWELERAGLVDLSGRHQEVLSMLGAVGIERESDVSRAGEPLRVWSYTIDREQAIARAPSYDRARVAALLNAPEGSTFNGLAAIDREGFVRSVSVSANLPSPDRSARGAAMQMDINPVPAPVRIAPPRPDHVIASVDAEQMQTLIYAWLRSVDPPPVGEVNG